MAKMFDMLMSAKARYVLFETSNPRHGHEWTVFRDRKADIPDTTILVPGVVDTTTNFVEHPELVAQRIERFVDIVGHDRVIAGSDCGFGTFAGFGTVDPSIAYAKLSALAEGAALVKQPRAPLTKVQCATRITPLALLHLMGSGVMFCKTDREGILFQSNQEVDDISP